MLKKCLLFLLILVMTGALALGCELAPEESAEEVEEVEEPADVEEPAEPAEPERTLEWIPATGSLSFEDGTYRGVFADGGEMQVNVQFSLEDNIITATRFRHLAYGGDDYLDSDDETIQGLAEQHEAMLDYLEGTDIRVSLSDLYDPGQIVPEEYDIDGFTGATLRGNKVISAFRDGLNRGVYSTDIAEAYSPVLGESLEDGTYRGVFGDGGEMQVNVQFSLENNTITATRFRQLAYGGDDYLDSDDETIQGLAEQHEMLLDYLEGTDIRASLADLYSPGNIVTEEHDVDGFTGATLRANKVISAFRDGLNRGVYSTDVAEAYSPLPDKSFEDGTYRGIFSDGGDYQVNVQFTLENNVITDIGFRQLAYGGIDYQDSDDETIQGLAEQHEMLLDYLEGTDIRASLADLYNPGNIVTEEHDVDGYTGATLRANKVISAIIDGLNRGMYR